MFISEATDEEMKRLEAEHKNLNPDREVSPVIIDSLKMYIDHGIMPGSFLAAVLTNDLFGAMGFADSYNRATIFQITSYIYNNLPSDSWGSVEKVSAFQEEIYSNLEKKQED